MDEAKPVTEETKPTTKPLTLREVVLAGLVLVAGVDKVVDVATVDQQVEKIKAAYIDTAEATCKTVTATERETTVREAINEVDSVDKVIVQRVNPQFKYNPLKYLKGETIEVIARIGDSTLFIGKFIAPSDTTSLLDVNVNLQPSAPPVKE